jgi:hypothetical protein
MPVRNSEDPAQTARNRRLRRYYWFLAAFLVVLSIGIGIANSEPGLALFLVASSFGWCFTIAALLMSSGDLVPGGPSTQVERQILAGGVGVSAVLGLALLVWADGSPTAFRIIVAAIPILSGMYALRLLTR